MHAGGVRPLPTREGFQGGNLASSNRTGRADGAESTAIVSVSNPATIARRPAGRGLGLARRYRRRKPSIFAWWSHRPDGRHTRAYDTIDQGRGGAYGVPPGDGERGEVAGGVTRRQTHRRPRVLRRRG
jgi:hypothetical protein